MRQFFFPFLGEGGGALIGLYSTWQPSKTKLSPDFCRGELNGPFTSRVWSWDNSIIDILHTLKHYADISIGRHTCSLHCATEKIKDLLWNVKVSQSVWGNGLKLEVICNSPSLPTLLLSEKKGHELIVVKYWPIAEEDHENLHLSPPNLFWWQCMLNW